MKNIITPLILLMLITTGCKKEATISSEMAETLYIRNGASDMPAYIYGNGSSNVFILVLHGGPGGNGLEYRSGTYAEELEKKYAMVYYDQRHQGNAHGNLKPEDVTIDAMVEDTHLLIQSLKERYGQDISLFLLGHSWGGTLGSAYMVKDDYQNELNGWIEVDGAHDIPQLNIELVKMIQEIGSQELLAGNNVSDWQEMIDYVNAIDTMNITFEQTGQLNQYGHRIEGLLSQLKEGDNAQTSIMQYAFLSPGNPLISTVSGFSLPEAFTRSVELANYTPELSKITIPTSLQWGKYDFVVPPALGYSAYDEISSADKFLKIYDYSGHSPMNNEPDLFIKDIVDFIEAYK